MARPKLDAAVVCVKLMLPAALPRVVAAPALVPDSESEARGWWA